MLLGKMYSVIEGIYNNKKLRKTCIPLFISNPGIGKTSIVNQFAKSKGVKCLSEIASTKMPHEFSGISIPNHKTKTMIYFDYDKLLELRDGDILFLDELLNANPMILNAFLTVLENRQLPSGTKLADIMIIAAANKQGSTSLTPQIKERFIWYNVEYDKIMFKKYLSSLFNITDTIFDAINMLISNETFVSSENNYFTPRSTEKNMNLIINNIYTPYEVKLKPILNTFIENTSDNDITINDYTFKKNQKLEWLKLQQLINGTFKK